MGYRHLDINLLPPELQPGPVVRYAVVINTLVIGVTVAFLVVDSFVGLTNMASLKRDIENKEDQIQAKATVVSDYNELTNIETHVNSVGRLIGLASAEYVEMPVVMERITKLLPEGVYLDRVTSEARTVGATTTNIRIILAASKPDPQMLVQTFNRFKDDDILGDCYMRVAEFEEREIGSVLEAAGVNWIAAGPGIGDYTNTEQFVFEIHSVLHPPVETGGLATVLDKTDYFDVFTETKAPARAAGESESGGQVAGAPEGVSVVEAN
jgi:hypothetical protein